MTEYFTMYEDLVPLYNIPNLLPQLIDIRRTEEEFSIEGRSCFFNSSTLSTGTSTSLGCGCSCSFGSFRGNSGWRRSRCVVFGAAVGSGAEEGSGTDVAGEVVGMAAGVRSGVVEVVLMLQESLWCHCLLLQMWW